MNKIIYAALLSVFCLAGTAQAAGFNFKPTGFTGYGGAGFALFHIENPQNTNFHIEPGIFANISGERGFDFAHLFLTFGFNYLHAEGHTNYGYTTLDGRNFSGSNVSFKADIFQAGMGLKFKLLTKTFVRPYVEGGGLGGYFQMNYSDIDKKVVGVGTDYKKSDALLEFGYYGEAGLEVNFSPTFGMRIAARYTRDTSKEFETLASQRIKYWSEIYYLCAMANF